MSETIQQFEERKRDHIVQALREENQARGQSGLGSIRLIHEALPDLDFSEVQIQARILNQTRETPFLASSMTAGHRDSINLNERLAKSCERHGWMMGVGSQRRELVDKEAREEWRAVRKAAPRVTLLGNLGLAQMIVTPTERIRELVDSLEAAAMIIHLNALQECLQPEGTPNYKGGLMRIAQLVKELRVPVVVKETGCGFSAKTLTRLKEAGVAAVDVGGFGGTHWGRIEGERAGDGAIQFEAAKTFADWGVSTADALLNAEVLRGSCEVWASGGVRTGLDAARALAIGANCVGFAQPLLKAALVSEEALELKMQAIELELKIALFVTGSRGLEDLTQEKVMNCR